MGVNWLYLTAASTAASAAALQWWSTSLVEKAAAGAAGETGRWGRGEVELLLGSHVAVGLVVNLVVHLFLLVVLALKSLFFVELNTSETRKVFERIINYIIYKGTFLPLVVPPNVRQLILWSTWLVLLCTLKVFQSLARDRLEQLNASPTTTPSKYFRVYSALLLVLSADLLWMKLCATVCRSCSPKLFLLLFFEPLSIAFETLQALMVHGFQLVDIWQRHLMDSGADYIDLQKSYKKAAGSLSEWKGKIIRNCGFIIDLMTLSMSLGHYSMIIWLRGMAFHLVDAVLLMNLRALITSVLKRIRTYIKLRNALSSLDGALPDATDDELCAYDDECAICRGPMARAKKLSCNHLFHLACLRSWLDQGLTEVYSCPTCRRPLFVSSQGQTSSTTREATNVQQIVEQLNLGLNQQRSGPELPTEQRNPSDGVWRGVGLDSGWAQPWSNPGMEGPSSSGAMRSVGFSGLSGVEMMVRHLASVSENHGNGDTSWNLWPSHPVAGSTMAPSSSMMSDGATPAPSLRLRGTSVTANGNMSEIISMVDRVREVLPHIPDELITQDLLRTNNINATVNNLLLMQ